jgi:hypothetical protein
MSETVQYSEPVTADECEPQPPRDLPLGNMWLFNVFGAVGAGAAVVMAPMNPGSWMMFVLIGGLFWFTRAHHSPEDGRRLPDAWLRLAMCAPPPRFYRLAGPSDIAR